MMFRLLENMIANVWNRLTGRRSDARSERGSVEVGFRVTEGTTTHRHFELSNTRRAMHVAVLGKTGTGKSSLLRRLGEQDIESDRGFWFFDLHGDAIPFFLKVINRRERQLRRHLSDKVIVIDPSDAEVSVGINPLENAADDFARISDVAEVLRQRWHLDHFGARTDELLRNSLFALAANDLTLLELALLLTDSSFRSACLKRVSNPEVRQYFELRYDQASEGMRATMREPILNKVTAFTSNPQLRHIVGQRQATFSLREAMDEGYWVFVNLPKGRLGEQALTFGSLLLTMLKNAVFTREKRSLFTVYADEIQNFVANKDGIETMLSESRKFGVALISANQFLDQYPVDMRAAILAAGTHVFFQLSSADAMHVSQALDGGKALAERLKNLRFRHCIVKSGPDRAEEVRVPSVRIPDVDPTDLVTRVRYGRGRSRVVIERDIAQRQAQLRRGADEVLDAWE